MKMKFRPTKEMYNLVEQNNLDLKYQLNNQLDFGISLGFLWLFSPKIQLFHLHFLIKIKIYSVNDDFQI